MTKTEKRIDEMINGVEEMELGALVELVHESYFFAYWEKAELTLENFLEKDTKTNVWRITDVQNDEYYDCSSIRECYETMYINILEKTFEEELKKERRDEEEDEIARETMTPKQYNEWLQW